MASELFLPHENVSIYSYYMSNTTEKLFRQSILFTNSDHQL